MRALYATSVALVVGIQLLTSAVCLYVRPDPDQELWLEDYTRNKVVSGDVQADSPGGTEDEDADPEEPQQCPTVGSADAGHDADVSTLACLLPKCDSDDDCAVWVGHKCCFNGCVDTCVTAIPPPPFVDWRQEPLRDPLTGVSWLIKDDEEQDAGELLLRRADHCSLHGQEYTDGQLFEHQHYQCSCQKGLIECNVRYEKVVLDHILDKFT